MPQNDVGIEISSRQHGNIRNVPSSSHKIRVNPLSHKQTALTSQPGCLKGRRNKSRLRLRQLDPFQHLNFTRLKLQPKRHASSRLQGLSRQRVTEVTISLWKGMPTATANWSSTRASTCPACTFLAVHFCRRASDLTAGLGFCRTNTTIRVIHDARVMHELLRHFRRDPGLVNRDGSRFSER